MRCLALAVGLRSHAVDAFFVCADQPGNMSRAISAHGFPLRLIRPCSTELDDAQATIEAVTDARPFDWLVVDSYLLGHRFEQYLYRSIGRILVIDDLHDRRHFCDLLVDASAVADDIGRYASLVAPSTICLLGQKYAPLRRAFVDVAREDRDFMQVRRVLVSYGGTDPLEMTSKAIVVAGNAAVRHIQFDVVIGPTNPRRRRLQARAKHLPNAIIHVDTPCMPELMARADLSLGAGGTTTWERMFMGLPSIVVSLVARAGGNRHLRPDETAT
jgi:UDP-2,4-diacetamido-2,4,6-trideoxy-beta-L-altropyranose hydrolase